MEKDNVPAKMTFTSGFKICQDHVAQPVSSTGQTRYCLLFLCDVDETAIAHQLFFSRLAVCQRNGIVNVVLPFMFFSEV